MSHSMQDGQKHGLFSILQRKCGRQVKEIYHTKRKQCGHIHHAKSGGGQILVCIGGRGYYQEEGEDAVEMKPGDCINIPAEVKHWHGAAPDEWFSHLAIEVPGEETSNEWCEAVSEKEYAGLR